jgi:iron(III) transport system ATP-binding protein
VDEGLTVEAVSKQFGTCDVLNELSLRVPQGSTCALLGPSGSGKSTLLRIIAGLERPDRGRGVLDGTVLFDQNTFVVPERRRLGMVFQDLAIFPHLSVARNVEFGLAKTERRHRDTLIDEALDTVGLTEFRHRSPSTLSGGQLQRVALARALAPRPRALLLDEPFSNLDVALRVQVRTDLHRLLAASGITTVVVTHDQQEAFLLGDQVAVMRDGRLLQTARPRELYDAPIDAWTAAFVGDVNLIEADMRDGVVETVLGSLPARTSGSGRVHALLRPESLMVTPGDDGHVELVEYYGHDTMIDVRLHNGVVVRARVRDEPIGFAARVAIRYTGGPVVTYPLRPEGVQPPSSSPDL